MFLSVASAPVHVLTEHFVHHFFLQVVNAQNLSLGQEFAVFVIIFFLNLVDFLTMREPVLYNLGGFGFGHRCFLVFVFAYFLWCRRPDFLLALGECGHKLLRCVFVEFQIFGDFLCLYFGELFA